MSELSIPTTDDEFKSLVSSIESGIDYQQPVAYALGLATVEGEGSDTTVLDVQFTRRNYAGHYGTAAVLAASLGQTETGLRTGQYLLGPEELSDSLKMFKPYYDADGRIQDGHANIETLTAMRRASNGVHPRYGTANVRNATNERFPVLGVVRNWEDVPESVADIYLRLYALSDRHRLPNTVNIVPNRDFGTLPNVVISERSGTFSVDKWNAVQEDLVYVGLSTAVRVLDKFPRMLDHVVPTGVRIADPSRVRLGAHVGSGTTIMHEGFINFNAGTKGKSMVEGRISAGVIVGEGSDIGGGASTQGTMSGGNKEVISIGEATLLEANSGIGISLGDHCRVEAGTYVKSTTPVKRPDGKFVKAIELSGVNNMLLRRNSISGEVEAVQNEGDEWGGLNEALHATN